MNSDTSAHTPRPQSSSGPDHALPSRPPSAIATFSNLFSPVNPGHILSIPSPIATLAVCNALRPKLPSAGLGTLPTEILMLIFQFAFEACIDWDKTGTFYPEPTAVWLQDDPLSPSLFPYSLASVCIRWLHILSSAAVYWTRQIITVDSHATSPIAIQTLLQWVGNLPIQIIVTRHPSISEEVDRDEYVRVRVVLDLLRPHTHHTWSLTFDVSHNSSLSALWREQGDAPHLNVLTLMNSRSDTGSMADIPRFPELCLTRNSNGYNTSLETRFLEEVTRGGCFFNDTLSFGKQCNNWSCNITSLTIRGYATSDGSGISLYRFISTIQTCGLLERLTVEDVAFINDVHPSYRFRLEAPVVHLRKLSDGGAFGCLVSQSLGIRLKEIVTILDCPFDGFGGRNLFQTRVSSTNLILEGMSASATAIEALVRFWNGENLSLINCPGVSGSFLGRFPVEETPPDLRRLRIVDCENVSAGGLISLVRSREIQSVIDALFPGDPDEELCAALVELHVDGRGPPISIKQAAWFAEHVETFSWNTVTRDGMQYSWDASARELSVLTTNP